MSADHTPERLSAEDWVACPRCHGATGWFVERRWWTCGRCNGRGFIRALHPQDPDQERTSG